MGVSISKLVDHVMESIKLRCSHWKVWFPPPALHLSIFFSKAVTCSNLPGKFENLGLDFEMQSFLSIYNFSVQEEK